MAAMLLCMHSTKTLTQIKSISVLCYWFLNWRYKTTVGTTFSGTTKYKATSEHVSRDLLMHQRNVFEAVKKIEVPSLKRRKLHSHNYFSLFSYLDFSQFFYLLFIVPPVLLQTISTLMSLLTLILRCSRTGTVWFYTSTSNKRAARPKL